MTTHPDLLQPDPWPQRKKELREDEWRIYRKLLAKCELGIDRLLSQPDDMLSANELTRLLDLAERIGRLAAGLPKENTASAADTNDDDRTRRLEVAAAIKKIYSQPLDRLIARVRQPPTINIHATSVPTPSS